MTLIVLDPATHTTASVPRFIKQFQRKQYRDKQFKGGEVEWKKKLEKSTTVYIGNLSCYTNEYQLYELFTRCGSIKRIVMGLDKVKKTPCGFCFVEFDDRESAMNSIKYLNRTKLDGRDIQVDIDAGFEDGRQYGRGTHGGQVGDERRRERESGGGQQQGGRGSLGSTPILTRSITVVACLTMISLLLIANQPYPVTSDTVRIPFFGFRSQNLSPGYIRRAQLNETRVQFEQSFAQFLVRVMKSAKPTLLEAFIKATLADKQLKDIAIALFFNNTSTNTDDD